MKRFLVLLFIVAGLSGSAQKLDSSRDTVKYERGFEFKAGIYLTFEDFKSNNAIAFENFVSKDGSHISWEASVRENKREIIYHILPDDTVAIDIVDIWGWSNGINIFYALEGGTIDFIKGGIKSLIKSIEFVRIPIIGSMCHITDFKGRNKRYVSRVNENKNYLMHIYPSHEFMISLKSDKWYDFSKKGMFEALADNDKDLLFHFEKESQGKYKSSLKSVLYKYLRIYNQKHPLYFPE